ncbi:MAG: EamA family transporter, partial [Rubrivivax sp.]
MPPVSRASATAPASTLPGSASARWTAPALRSVALGLLGVAIFALTLPMTRLAVGPVEAPQLPPAFVTAGRAAVAGLLSALVLLGGRASAPPRAVWRALAVSALGTVL